MSYQLHNQSVNKLLLAMRKSYIVKDNGKYNYASSSRGSSESQTPLLNYHQPRKELQSPELSSVTRKSMSMDDRLRDKFRGCLVGALIGDCIGTLFECDYSVSYSILGDLYLSCTRLSEDEKLMDLHGIDFSLGPKIAQELLERKQRASIAPLPEKEKATPPPPKRHSSFERSRRASFSRPIEKFSDDLVMVRSVARSLIRMKGFEARDMAIQLTEDYFLNLTRKYGAFTREIFTQLRNAGYQDPYSIARKISGKGTGSQGNEGATRVAPLSLFAWQSDSTVLLELSSKVTRLTNYHKSAVIGAAVQALAVHTAFNWEFNNEAMSGDSSSLSRRLRNRLTPSPQTRRKHTNQENIPLCSTSKKAFDSKEFCKIILEGITHADGRTASLLENLKNFIVPNRDFSETVESAYVAKIQTIMEFLDRTELPPRAEVVEKLGNGVKSLDSVPTALFSFLVSASRADFSELPVEIQSPVLRSIFYAISLGGDSDTIAAMSGAIAGAFWGYASIPQEILRVCEGSRDFVKIADNLFNLLQK